MAFKDKQFSKESVELVSIIDIMFILLVFFLVSSIFMHTASKEEGIYIPAPETERGRAQIVIQIRPNNQYLWIDENIIHIYNDIHKRRGWFLSDRELVRQIINQLISRNMYNRQQLETQLNILRKNARDNPDQKYFVLIRCPNDEPFFRAVDLISYFSDFTLTNLRYGCVAGNLDDLLRSRRIERKIEIDETGKERENIYIDF